MTDFAKKSRIPAVILTLAFSLCAVILRTVLLLSHYDPAIGQFDSGAAADLFFPLLFVLALVVFGFYAFLLRGVKAASDEGGGIPMLFSSSFAIVATAVWLISFLMYFFRLKPMPTGYPLVFGLLLIPAAIALVLFFVFSIRRTSHWMIRPLTAYGAVAFCLIYAFFAYFDGAFTLNSPIKIFDQVTFVALALFFLLECRRSLGKDSLALRLPLSLFCFVLCAASSIPNLIYTAVTGASVFPSIMHDFLLLALLLYVAAVAVTLLPSEEKTDEAPKAAPELPESELPLLPDDPSDYEIPTEDLARLSESGKDTAFDATVQGTSEFDPTLH